MAAEIEITKGLRNEMYVKTRKHLMQHIHSVHPALHPDLFKRIEVINDNDLSDLDYVVCENKYQCESDGTKTKKFRKYKFVSEFTNSMPENNLGDRQIKRNKRCVGLVKNE